MSRSSLDIKSRIEALEQQDGTTLAQQDPWLNPYKDTMKRRYQKFINKLKELEEGEGFDQLTSGYQRFGFNRVNGGILYQDWCPNAKAIHLVGEFNDWNTISHPLTRLEYGKWQIFLPDSMNGPVIKHNTKVKVAITYQNGEVCIKIPAWIKCTKQEKGIPVLDGIYWESSYEWKHEKPQAPSRIKIYETHIGMATEKYEVGTYKNFKENVLPYIAESGYNAIQIMAIMEHSYYASFGYQVTNFFAPASRFGTPDELKELIDEAHRLGIVVLLDLIHSHASKNIFDGINFYDGTDSCFFHSTESGRGVHYLWDSRLFNYNEWEVLRFLLSNVRYWLEEFKFDGFRFDGVTSMIYKHHGVGKTPMSYDEYYGDEVDEEALLYLTLANFLIHEVNPNAITICEEVSGFVGLCRSIQDGGFGFNYRLAMGLPDKWIELMKLPDEKWNMGNIVFTMTNRRWGEDNIAYAESHDQAIVGDKTLIFWLLDKEMYESMTILKERSLIIDRGIALHKMIRLITFSLAGEGYLNFMGNEFGHPEWIDFPREGNNNSFHYCRRQWSLKDDHLLRYKHLKAFDTAMLKLDNEYPVFRTYQFVSRKHEDDKVIVYERGDTTNLVFVFNLHTVNSYQNYRIGVRTSGKYKIQLDSDLHDFGGHERNDPSTEYFTEDIPYDDRPYSMQIYIPSRVAIVYRLVESSLPNR